MADMWITSMKKFSANQGQLADIPSSTRRYVKFLAQVTVSVLEAEPGVLFPTETRCRRRPGRKPCLGTIQALWDETVPEIRWFCTVCEDNGIIRDWDGLDWLRELVPAKNKSRSKTPFKIIRGGMDNRVNVGQFQIAVAPPFRRPYPVGAVVLEEDTYLVLSSDPEIKTANDDSHFRLYQEIKSTLPAEPGTIIERGKTRGRWLAVVHDLSRRPSWRREWVREALIRALDLAESRQIRAIALPLLGTLYGGLKRGTYLSMLVEILRARPEDKARNLWLMVPEGTESSVLDCLDDITKQGT